MPSVLIETGFITNKSEGDYLNSVEGSNNISKSISDAILDYRSNLNTETFVQEGRPSTEEVETTPETVKPVEPDNSPNNSDTSIVFKVQIASGSKKLATKSYNFNGLNDISRTKSKSMYRYFYGQTSSYDTVVELKNEALNKGYKSAFIVAYKNGERIAIKTALKSTE
jgi:N-acetylmuramoyl-L-alanine amidase